MVGGSLSDNTTREMAGPTIMTTPDAGDTPSLRGTPLTDCWKIGEHVPRADQKHATVYLVVDKVGLPVEDLEAHAFVLRNIEPKTRKHRLRCIKRMVQRTKLQVTVDDVAIVVISTLPTTKDDNSEKAEAAYGPGTDEGRSKPDMKAAQKTSYEQESARIRQRERRRAMRSRKGEEHLDTADIEGNKTETFNMDEHTGFAAFLILVWILCDETGTMKDEIPAKHHDLVKGMGSDSLYESLEQYLKQTDIEFKSPAEMASYLRAKRGERRSMQRELDKLLGAEKYHNDKLGALDQEQAQYQEDSEEWQQIQTGRRGDAALQCQIVAHAQTALPRILASQKSRIRSVERKLARAARNEEREALLHDVDWYKELTHVVFPISDARADAVRQWEGAQIALAAFDHKVTSKV